MKKALIFLTMVLLIFFSCSKEEEGEKNVMKGVKTATETEVKANMRFGVLSLGDTIEVTVSHYNENGFLTQYERYDEDGLQVTESYEWGDKHCEMLRTFCGLRTSHTYKSSIDYDDNWRMSYLKSFDSEGNLSDEVWYVCNEKGNILSEKRISYGSLSYTAETKYSHQYDDKGRILYTKAVTVFDDGKERIEEYSYTYNKDGSYTIDEVLSDKRKRVEKFDSKGNILERVTHNENQADYKDVYEYDSKGRITKHTLSKDEVPDTIWIYEYEYY